MKILTVDDSKPIRMIVQRAFREYDCQVLEAGDGVEGLAVAKRELPNLIILDITMPLLDGYETLSKLKEDEALKNIPVIMLTAEAGRENVLRIAKLGVKGYLLKPFKDDAIVQKVLTVVQIPKKTSEAAAAPEENQVILVVEDKAPIVNQIKAALADSPWKVESVEDTKMAAAFCAKSKPSAIIISLSLPQGSAFPFLQDLRADKATTNVPVIGVCLMSASADQQKARQCGVGGILHKPLTPANVKAAVEKCLKVDTISMCFAEENDRLVISLPAEVNENVADKLFTTAQAQIPNALENGILQIVLDGGRVQEPDIFVIRAFIALMDLSESLGAQCVLRGSESLKKECANFEESKHWEFQDESKQETAAA